MLLLILLTSLIIPIKKELQLAKLLQYFGQITAVISCFTAVICKNYSLTVVLFQLGNEMKLEGMRRGDPYFCLENKTYK
jgi:hypothetical protein